MEIIHVVVIVVYLLFIALATRLAQRRVKGSRDFIIAGGRMGLGVYIALTIGQWIGGITVIGGAQRAYLKGISAGWFGITIATGIILAGLLARRIRESGVITVPGLISKVFGEAAGKISNYALTLSFLIALSLQVAAGGSILSVLFPEVPEQVLMVVTASIFALYIYLGGIWAAGIVNVVHIILMYGGLITAVILELQAIGGFSSLVNTLPPNYFSLTGVGELVILSWVITSAVAVIGNQTQLQIIKSAKDTGTAVKGCFIGALIVAPAGILAAILGTTAAALFPNIPSISALPYLIVSTLNPLIGGLLIAGLWAAILSTAAPVLVGLSTLVTKIFYNVDEMSDEEELFRRVRISVIVIAAITTLLALTIRDILKGIVLANNFRIPIALGMVLALYGATKRTPKPVALGVILSIILAAVCAILGMDALAPALILISSLAIYALIK